MKQAKRIAPKKVNPITINGINFIVEHFKEKNLQAFDSKGKKLWEIKLPKVKYDKDMETDVQDVFIEKLYEENKQLVAIDEHKVKYVIDPKTGKILSKGTEKERGLAKFLRTIFKQ